MRRVQAQGFVALKYALLGLNRGLIASSGVFSIWKDKVPSCALHRAFTLLLVLILILRPHPQGDPGAPR